MRVDCLSARPLGVLYYVCGLYCKAYENAAKQNGMKSNDTRMEYELVIYEYF